MQTRRNRCIGEHQIDLVHGEIREEAVERSLAAYDAHGLLQTERGLEQPMCDLLGYHIIYPDDEP